MHFNNTSKVVENCDINTNFRGGKGIDFIRKMCHAVISDEKRKFQQALKMLQQYLDDSYKFKLEYLVQKYLNIESENVVQLSKYMKLIIN